MPIVKALATILVCDFCPATTSHITGTGAPLSSEYFETQHWAVLDDGTTVACPRCSPVLTTVTEYTSKGVDILAADRSSSKTQETPDA